MYNFKIVCDNGTITYIRARLRHTAIQLYCTAEGCPETWFYKHCRITKVSEVKDESKDTE